MIEFQKESFEIKNYDSSFSIKNKIGRLLWSIVYICCFRPFPTRFFKKYRCFVLKSFGAKITYTSHVYSSVKIWAPWNLEMGNYSTLGPYVDCYNQGKITIGNNVVISQKTYLCASSHDYKKNNFPLIKCPIKIGNNVWIAADCFIGPNVSIGESCIVGARSSVFKSFEKENIIGGNPAHIIKTRN